MTQSTQLRKFQSPNNGGRAKVRNSRQTLKKGNTRQIKGNHEDIETQAKQSKANPEKKKHGHEEKEKLCLEEHKKTYRDGFETSNYLLKVKVRSELASEQGSSSTRQNTTI